MRDPRRLPSIEPTLQCFEAPLGASRCLREGHTISQVLPPGFAFRCRFANDPWVVASPRSCAFSFEAHTFGGRTSSIDFCSYDTLMDTTLFRKPGPRTHRLHIGKSVRPLAFRRESYVNVKTTHTALSRSAPSHFRMTDPVCNNPKDACTTPLMRFWRYRDRPGLRGPVC